MQALEPESLCYQLSLACLPAALALVQASAFLPAKSQLAVMSTVAHHKQLLSAAGYKKCADYIATSSYLVSVCFCSARCSSTLLPQPRVPAGAMALDIRIAGRYRLGRKIGSGSFGDIYLGRQGTAEVPVSVMLAGQKGKKAEVCDRTLMRCMVSQAPTSTPERRLASSW